MLLYHHDQGILSPRTQPPTKGGSQPNLLANGSEDKTKKRSPEQSSAFFDLFFDGV
jgi:hypothetical protein